MALSKIQNNSFADTAVHGRRNLIINGAMQVAQRGTQSTGITTTGFRTVDRFRTSLGTLGTWTEDQATDAPDGFSNSFKLTCTTADASPAAGDVAYVRYMFEGNELQGLAYGSSSAKALTLSFWVKSNKTGSATVQLLQNDNSSRNISPSYTISSANTWEYKTVSIPADTAGNIDNDNGPAVSLIWWLNSGSNFSSGTTRTTWTAYSATDSNPANLGVGGATSDYFQITGVQLELGEQATPFEHRSFSQELEACRRYFVGMGAFYSDFWGQTGTQIVGVMIGAHQNNAFVSFKTLNGTQMRATPTAVIKGTPKLTNFSANQQNLTAAGITSNHTLNFTYDGSQRTALEHIAINASDSGAGFGLDAEL